MMIADTVEELELWSPYVAKVIPALNTVARKQFAAFADLFPFKSGWEMNGYCDDSWYVLRLVDRPGAASNRIARLADDEVSEILEHLRKIAEPNLTYTISSRGESWFQDLG